MEREFVVWWRGASGAATQSSRAGASRLFTGERQRAHWSDNGRTGQWRGRWVVGGGRWAWLQAGDVGERRCSSRREDAVPGWGRRKWGRVW